MDRYVQECLTRIHETTTEIEITFSILIVVSEGLLAIDGVSFGMVDERYDAGASTALQKILIPSVPNGHMVTTCSRSNLVYQLLVHGNTRSLNGHTSGHYDCQTGRYVC